MRKILVLFLCLGLAGCATAYKINQVSLGMTKAEVIKVMGEPVSISATENQEYLNYQLAETAEDGFNGDYTPYAIVLQSGKVASYGRHGDFGTTEQSAQVIKVISDEKKTIDLQTNDNELAVKLKTLNKLLSDKLITQAEYSDQKQKLLNEYTSK